MQLNATYLLHEITAWTTLGLIWGWPSASVHRQVRFKASTSPTDDCSSHGGEQGGSIGTMGVGSGVREDTPCIFKYNIFLLTC